MSPAGDGLAARQAGNPAVALAVLSLISAFNFGDRQLIAVLAEPIRLDFGLTDTQLGLLTGPFFAVAYTALGLPLAWLADRTNRVYVLAGACATWSLFTLISGLAGSFLQLGLARIGVGIGEAGGTPASHGLIAGFYGPSRRGMAMAVFGYSGIVGAAVGAAAGAWIAASHDWRTAFIAVGAPGIVLALALMLLVRDPRTQAAKAPAAGATFADALSTYGRSPGLVYVTIAGCISSLLTYGLLNWLPALLMREKGMSLDEIGRYFSLASALFMGLGLLGAGYVGDKFGRRHPHVYAALPALGLLTGAVTLAVGLLSRGWGAALVLLTLTGGLIITHAPLALTLVQNAMPPSQRSLGSAIYGLTATVVGLGVGPLLIGFISDTFGGLKTSMLALTPLFLLGAMFYVLAARRLGGLPAQAAPS